MPAVQICFAHKLDAVTPDAAVRFAPVAKRACILQARQASLASLAGLALPTNAGLLRSLHTEKLHC